LYTRDKGIRTQLQNDDLACEIINELGRVSSCESCTSHIELLVI